MGGTKSSCWRRLFTASPCCHELSTQQSMSEICNSNDWNYTGINNTLRLMEGHKGDSRPLNVTITLDKELSGCIITLVRIKMCWSHTIWSLHIFSCELVSCTSPCTASTSFFLLSSMGNCQLTLSKLASCHVSWIQDTKGVKEQKSNNPQVWEMYIQKHKLQNIMWEFRHKHNINCWSKNEQTKETMSVSTERHSP